MHSYPDLSQIPIEQATDGLLQQLFYVQNRKPKTWELDWPETDSEMILADGSIAHVTGTGSPILVVHGFEGRYTQFWPQAERLLKEGACIIGLTLPGHGAASGHPNPLAFSKAIETAYKMYGPFEAIIGHSQGATASLHAVANGVETKKLVLISPVASIETHLRNVCSTCLLYTSPSPRDRTRSRMPSSA